MTPASDQIEAYRKIDLRLRLLLLGDGIDTPGLVRGEESRRQVLAELRHLRDVFTAAVVESEAARAEKAEARDAGLEEELQRIAFSRSRTLRMGADAIPELLTPAEAAHALGMSVGSIYRAVRNGELRAVRLTDTKRGAIRIPASELQRLFEGARGTAVK